MTLTELKKLGEQYDENHVENNTDSAELTQRLKTLVEVHGVSAVAAVLGKTAGSVLSYTRYKQSKYGCVKYYDVVKAETILNKHM